MGTKANASGAVTCICGRVYDAKAWSELPAVRTLGGADVRPYVVAWPAGAIVEVRSCAACSRPIARTRRPETRGPAGGPASPEGEAPHKESFEG